MTRSCFRTWKRNGGGGEKVVPEMKSTDDEHCNLYHSWRNGSPATPSWLWLGSGGGKEKNKVYHKNPSKNHPTNSYLGFYLKLSFMRIFPSLSHSQYDCVSGSGCRAGSQPPTQTLRVCTLLSAIKRLLCRSSPWE